MFKNRTKLLLLGITLLAIVLRIIRMLEMNRYDVDCYAYFNMAINWAKYGTEYAYRNGVDYCPPLLPWLMAMGYKLGIQPDVTALFFGIMLGSLIPLCLYYIVNNLFSTILYKSDNSFDNIKSTIPVSGGRRAVAADNGLCESYNIFGFKLSDLALLAALIAAVHPSLVRISVRCLRDTLYVPLVAIALVFAVSAIKNKAVSKWCLFACVSTIASFARYEGLELIIIFVVWLTCEMLIQRRTLIGNFMYYLLSIVTVLLIFSSLTLIVNYSLKVPYLSYNTFYSTAEGKLT